MSELREFVADLLERTGAAVERVSGQELAVIAPAPVRNSMAWPELARLRFGAQQANDAIPIGLEGDWMERFAALLGDEGRWSEREVRLANGISAPSDPHRVLDRALDLPNAVWRFLGMTATRTRCLILTFRYTARSDEKREGLIWLGFNTGTSSLINNLLPQLRPILAQAPEWEAPDPVTLAAAGPRWNAAMIESRVFRLIDRQLRDEIEPFLRAARRRLTRDRDRIHAFHDELHRASTRRLAALSRLEGERVEADRRRETIRVETIEREHRAKLDDLRRNYALRVSIEWVQALELYLPVQRFDVLVRRRKGERVVRLDWHPLVKAAELPLCEAGLGRARARLVCDEKLHLTEPAAQAPCSCCERPFCRACFPAGCPRCGTASTASEA